MLKMKKKVNQYLDSGLNRATVVMGASFNRNNALSFIHKWRNKESKSQRLVLFEIELQQEDSGSGISPFVVLNKYLSADDNDG